MADFSEKRAAYKSARAEYETARDRARSAYQDVRKLERSLAAARRRAGPNDAALARLAARVDEAREQAERSLRALESAESLQHESLGRLDDDLDPREAIGRLDDTIPILMLSLRIETRFMLRDPDAPELWVRAFPDDWAVDSFEKALSEQEIASGAQFWSEFWAAGRVGDEQIGAWRALVASHGEGRGAWVVRRYRPVDETSEPAAKTVGDVILVVAGDALPALPLRAAAAVYWEAVWRNDEDAAREAAARTVLETALGTADAEAVLAQPPFNLSAPPAASAIRADTSVSVAWLELPAASTLETKTASWTEAARTEVLPERLALVLQTGSARRTVVGRRIPPALTLGLDPGAPVEAPIRDDKGNLQPPEALRWMFDFEAALDVGLAFRVSLSGEEAVSGFDRVLVAGVRLLDDADESRTAFESLLLHHRYSGTGCSLIAQGTPTNNTESGTSGDASVDDTAASFERVFGERPALDESDRRRKLDGQWFAEWLGIDVGPVQELANAAGRDQCESRAMNTALWPATMGYTLDTLMAGLLDSDATEQTRQVFTRYVSPRGPIPALRIGDQPYGILPTTAWSKAAWLESQGDIAGASVPGKFTPRPTAFLRGYYDVLRMMSATWTELVAKVPHVAQTGDLHQVLLDTLGLAPNSLEFFRRNADSLDQTYNLLALQGFGGDMVSWLSTASHLESGMALLRELGYTGDETPELLEFFFHQGQDPIADMLVDDVERSETDPVRTYTDDGRNYLAWLTDAARTSLDTLRAQTGFTGDTPPDALLYQLLRHALELSFWDTGLRMHEALAEPILSPDALALARAEPKFIHVVTQTEVSESRYVHLYQAPVAITGSADVLLADHIVSVLGRVEEAARFREVLDAIDHLASTPTARLERLLVEHLDACTYRLDAWKDSLTHYQLSAMRFGTDENQAARSGLYLGAYGWLEDLRPRGSQPSPAKIPAELQAAFETDMKPLYLDPENQGFIHAPSLDQATTAAVLRSTYLSDARESEAATMAVNLSSWRVRQALTVIEGLRNDQSLGELLGYRFERDLHEDYELAETDEFIFALRTHFPLVSNHLEETRVDLDGSGSVASIEARNVIDGLALSEHISSTGETEYPFGLANLPTASAEQKSKIDAAADGLRNVHDATADLAIAESLHQALRGNMDASAATMDAFGSATFPPLSSFVETPREGIGITQRTALFLNAAAPATSPWAGVPMSPRATAEPSINAWLATLLPAPEDIVVDVRRRDTEETRTLDAKTLGLQPIDWMYLLRLDDRRRAAALDSRIENTALALFANLWPQDGVEILYTQAPGAGQVSLFELAPLLASARRMVTGGRSLRPSDLALPTDAVTGSRGNETAERARLEAGLAVLESLRDDLANFRAPLEADLADTATHRASLLANAEVRLVAFTGLCLRGSEIALTEADHGLRSRWRARFFGDLFARLQSKVERWKTRRSQCDGWLAKYDALPAASASAELFRPLQRAERLIHAGVTAPLPDTPAEYRTGLIAQRATFLAKLAELQALTTTVRSEAGAFLDAIEATLPWTEFDAEEWTLAAEEASVFSVTSDAVASATAMGAALEARVSAVELALAAFDGAGDSGTQVDAIQGGLRVAYGKEFVALSHFTLGTEQAAELGLAHADSGALLRHVRDDLGRAFPLDDWLHSVARVRETLEDWEYTTATAELLAGATLDLTAWQLPYKAADHWVGGDLPESYRIEGDRLLVTAHHVKAFDPAAQHTGLLLDEWTEVIPSDSITTGIAFHVDQPNSEPPHAFLLLTPTAFRGGWQWDDVVDALDETLDAAKQRAVEPEQVDTSAYALFLPATLSATTHHPLTIGLNYAAVNGFTPHAIED